MANANVMELTDATFEETVASSDLPVLVDFWATWCPPCRVLSPIVDQLADDYKGRLKVAKVDIDQNNLTAEKMGIQAVPTLMIFKGGELKEKLLGAQPRESLAQIIDQHV